jgi:hypothetical protein
LAQVKALPEDCKSNPSILRSLVFNTVQHAKDFEFSRGSTEVDILDELDRTMTALLKPTTIANFWSAIHQVPEHANVINALAVGPDLRDREMNLLVKQHVRRAANPWVDIIPESDCDSLLAIAVRCRLYKYVELKVKDHGTTAGWAQQTRVLSQALKSGISLTDDSGSEFCWRYEIDLSMLRLLLELGVSPVWRSRGSGATAWLEFLQDCLIIHSKDRTTAAQDMEKFLNPDRQTALLRQILSKLANCC